VAIKYTMVISMTYEEMKALRDQLAVITPVNYSTEQVSFLRELYARLDRKVAVIESHRGPGAR